MNDSSKHNGDKMKKYTSFLDETFNSPYKYEWLSKDSQYQEGRFEIDSGDEISFDFTNIGGLGHVNGDWSFSFGRGKYVRTYVTGEGDQYRIFATIVKILEDFYEHNKTTFNSLHFTADKPGGHTSRTRLYTSMAQRFAKKHGLNFEIDPDEEETAFIISKPVSIYENNVDETFDTPYKFDWITTNDDRWKAEFTTSDNKLVQVYLSVLHTTHKGEKWNLVFMKNGRYDKTEDGDQFRIFATIISILKDFVDKVRPDAIVFSADKIGAGLSKRNLSRASLYRSMIKRFATNHGYEADINDSSDTETVFNLKRTVNEAYTKPSFLLKEAFDKPYPWKWIKQTNGIWYATFASGDGGKVEVEFARLSIVDDEKGEYAWAVAFAKNGKFTMTNEKDQFRIFSTVLDIISDFLKTKSPYQLHFDADKPLNDTKSENPAYVSQPNLSRSNLYTRMVKTLSSKAGYSYKVDDNYLKTDFVLTRK